VLVVFLKGNMRIAALYVTADWVYDYKFESILLTEFVRLM